MFGGATHEQLVAVKYGIGDGSGGSVNLSAYATLESPTFTGIPKAPLPSSTDDSTQLATTAFVNAKLSEVTGVDLTNYAPLESPQFTGVPKGTAIASDTTSSYQLATVSYVLGKGYATVANPQFTGIPLGSEIASGTNLTTSKQLATVKWVAGKYAPINDPTFTGTPNSSAPHPSENSAMIATTKWVKDLHFISTDNPVLLEQPISTDSTLKLANTAWVKQFNYASKVGETFSGACSFTGTITVPTVAADETAKYAIYPSWVTEKGYAPLASPSFTGTPVSITPAPEDSSTKIATTEYVSTSFLRNTNSVLKGNPTLETAVPSNTASDSLRVATVEYVHSKFAKLSGAIYTGPVQFNSTANVQYRIGSGSTVLVALAMARYDTLLDTTLSNTTYTGTQTFNVIPKITVNYGTIDTTNSTDRQKIPTIGWIADNFLTTTEQSMTNITFGGLTTFNGVATYSTGQDMSGYAGTGVSGKYVPDMAWVKALFVNNPNLEGEATAVTAATDNSSTRIATTAFVRSAINSYAASGSFWNIYRPLVYWTAANNFTISCKKTGVPLVFNNIRKALYSYTSTNTSVVTNTSIGTKNVYYYYLRKTDIGPWTPSSPTPSSTSSGTTSSTYNNSGYIQLLLNHSYNSIRSLLHYNNEFSVVLAFCNSGEATTNLATYNALFGCCYEQLTYTGVSGRRIVHGCMFGGQSSPHYFGRYTNDGNISEIYHSDLFIDSMLPMPNGSYCVDFMSTGQPHILIVTQTNNICCLYLDGDLIGNFKYSSNPQTDASLYNLMWLNWTHGIESPCFGIGLYGSIVFDYALNFNDVKLFTFDRIMGF